jgi:hypothetical protein
MARFVPILTPNQSSVESETEIDECHVVGDIFRVRLLIRFRQQNKTQYSLFRPLKNTYFILHMFPLLDLFLTSTTRTTFSIATPHSILRFLRPVKSYRVYLFVPTLTTIGTNTLCLCLGTTHTLRWMGFLPKSTWTPSPSCHQGSMSMWKLSVS